MLLPEIKCRKRFDKSAVSESLPEAVRFSDPSFDIDSWELFGWWKEKQVDCFGGGNSAPAIPHSQRQYDGENQFDYCEVLVLR